MALVCCAPLAAQAPFASAEPALHETRHGEPRQDLLRRARRYLQQEDPWQAVVELRRLEAAVTDPLSDGDLQEGLARSFLMLGHSRTALGHLRRALGTSGAPGESLTALQVRILLRGARFQRALEVSTAAVAASARPTAELLAAHASALFRLQRVAESANAYRRVLERDPLHAEAHLRLGSGLQSPQVAKRIPEIQAAVRLIEAQRLQEAVGRLQQALDAAPGHPIAHRLLGETLLRIRMAETMASNSEAFARLAAAMPPPADRDLPVERFVPVYDGLPELLRPVVVRAVSLFPEQLPKLLAMGARHDLLALAERTTDDPSRAGLRGRRTFDGRVWDDVRGVGGRQAATGVEALDDARCFGFDTLAHEVTHQAHLYAFRQVERMRVRQLYHAARLGGRCLDFYAASNEAEYFAQGVEAFVSLAKRPGCQKTHGHTRFELYRVDPDLYRMIEARIGYDPLRDPAHREELLPLCAEVAIACGRPRDGLVAAGWMPRSPARDRLLQRAHDACKVLGLPGRSQ